MASDVKAPIDSTSSRPSSFVSISPPRSISPSRRSISSNVFDDEPPPYSAAIAEPNQNLPAVAVTAPQQPLQAVVPDPEHPLRAADHDPRSSSNQDLPLEHQPAGNLRTLLLVYVHGFMGDETSFQSFPAHVHNLLSVMLGNTHVVVSRIYPRYLTKRALTVASEDFSKWLAPHESPTTDVVLLGHSMGGLVAADVALLPSNSPRPSPMRHRIIGTINFDVPFLGMHPGIIMSGLTSIFKPYPKPESPAASDTASSYDPSATGAAGNWGNWQGWANFNQPWANDQGHERRNGWKNAWHFVNKHSNDLSNATKQLVQNHLEFGSTVADYENLRQRYTRLRMLEEDEQKKRDTVVTAGSAPRVRFVNYYTASTGRPKKSKADESSPSLEKQRSMEKTPSLAPSESAPSYGRSTEDGADDASDVTSISSVSTSSSLSSLSSSDVDEDALAEPTTAPRAPKPPLLTDYDGDLAAFKKALEQYRLDTKAYVRALRDFYSRPQRQKLALKQQEIKAKAAQKQAEAMARAEEAKLEAYMRAEEARLVSQARTPEERKMAIDAMRDRRQREVEVRRELAKTKSMSDKESSKSASSCGYSAASSSGMSRQERKQERKQIKRDFKAEINAVKKERKHYKRELKRQWKQLKKERRAMRKAKGKGRADPGRSSISSGGYLNDAAFDAEAAHAANPHLPRSASDMMPSEKSAKSINSETASIQSGESGPDKKDRKFCLLPPRDARGNTDHTWKRVYMADVDEVGAHCGLFFTRGMTGTEPLSEGSPWGGRYAWMVSDVAERIEHWVHAEATEQLAMGVRAL